MKHFIIFATKDKKEQKSPVLFYPAVEGDFCVRAHGLSKTQPSSYKNASVDQTLLGNSRWLFLRRVCRHLHFSSEDHEPVETLRTPCHTGGLSTSKNVAGHYFVLEQAICLDCQTHFDFVCVNSE